MFYHISRTYQTDKITELYRIFYGIRTAQYSRAHCSKVLCRTRNLTKHNIDNVQIL